MGFLNPEKFGIKFIGFQAAHRFSFRPNENAAMFYVFIGPMNEYRVEPAQRVNEQAVDEYLEKGWENRPDGPISRAEPTITIYPVAPVLQLYRGQRIGLYLATLVTGMK